MTSQAMNLLEDRLSDFMLDLEQIVSIDSGTRNKAGVDAVGSIFLELLAERGWSVQVHPQVEFGDCIEARMTGSGDVQIMLLGHLDTVYPDGTAAERPFKVEGERALGPGVADMKSGLLAGLYAVEALTEAGFNNFGEIVFFINSEEEIGSPVSTPVYTSIGEGFDVGFVLEPGRANGNLVSARKGGGRYHIKVTGREAHAGVSPELGANAIVELSHQIQAITAFNGLNPGTTINVGVVNGGTRSNVVPAFAEARVDVRVAEVAGIQRLEQAVAALSTDTVVPGTTVEITGGMSKPPVEKTPEIAQLVELAQTIAHQLGFEIQDAHTGGMSDGNSLAGVGVPVLDGLGPVGGNAHSPDEYLEIASIVPRTTLLAGLIEAVC